MRLPPSWLRRFGVGCDRPPLLVGGSNHRVTERDSTVSAQQPLRFPIEGHQAHGGYIASTRHERRTLATERRHALALLPEEGQMADYRLFLLDGTGRIIGAKEHTLRVMPRRFWSPRS